MARKVLQGAHYWIQKGVNKNTRKYYYGYGDGSYVFITKKEYEDLMNNPTAKKHKIKYDNIPLSERKYTLAIKSQQPRGIMYEEEIIPHQASKLKQNRSPVRVSPSKKDIQKIVTELEDFEDRIQKLKKAVIKATKN